MIVSRYVWDVSAAGVVPDSQIFPTILKNRSIDDLHAFFHMGREALHDPMKLDGLPTAVTRIRNAIAKQEKILIFGDYDCDGITSISVMMRALRKAGANVAFDLPDRFQDGYGLNMRAVADIIQQGIQLVITVDNGITCAAEVKALQVAGIDTIVTDHHEPKDIIPEAFAIVHPKLSPEYPFKELAGVGVAYKLASAVLNDDLPELADLVMIGTIADMMPLVDENQALVNLGIARLKKTTNIGLRKIIEASNIDLLNETAVAFKIAPKINSSGRMNKAKDAVELLITESEPVATKWIAMIEQHHSQRKDLTDDAYLLAESLIRPADGVFVIADKRLHEGIIGICAQKLVEKYQETTVVLTIDEQGIGKGSMRVAGDDSALSLLESASDLLTRFGGHAQAAGLQIPEANIDAFRERLNLHPSEPTRPTMKIDMEVALANVSIKTIAELEAYSFFTARFLIRNLEVKSRQIMAEKHTKIVVFDGLRFYDAVAFNTVDLYYAVAPGDKLDIVCGLSVNTWRNQSKLQLMIKDVACEGLQVLDFRNPDVFADARQVLVKTPLTALYGEESILSGDLWPNEAKTVWVVPRSVSLDWDKYASRTGLGELYRILQSAGSIDCRKLEFKTGLSPILLRRLVDVFVELGLATRDDHVVSVIPTHLKKDLEKAAAFGSLKKDKARIDTLYACPEADLRRLQWTKGEE
jgi:single-stranded-DNA-specific exonuclease